ncbi:MAG TPA: redox-regulated ATPase YchF [Armatimonadetes bacterium]|nr:redox-regulated ATPase YchF [Armatimonadota bacterium]
MKVGFLGFPGSGKTTLFNVVTGRVEYPAQTGRPESHLAVVKVPDDRLFRLAEILSSKEIIQPEMTFVDLAPLHRENGDGGQRDGLMKLVGDAAALALVIQCFGEFDAEGNPLDPADDLESLLLEMTITDLGVVERRLERIEAELKSSRDKSSAERTLLQRVASHLGEGKLVADLDLTEEETMVLRGFALLTHKPLLVVLNVAEDDLDGERCRAAAQVAQEMGLACEIIAATLEEEIAALEDEMRDAFLADYGLSRPARDRFIRACYDLLGVITFFTGNHKDARGWTIEGGRTVRDAGGKIHSDIYDGFIRAEITPFAKLDELGSFAACRQAGVMRLEGRDYLTEDGDYLDIRFSR